MLDVLQSKHPEAQIPDADDFNAYESCPDLPEIDITEEVACTVARRLRGSTGPGASDAAAIQQWLL